MFDKDYVKAQIDAVRELIGRTVTVYTPVNPDYVASGYYDPMTDTSFNVQLEATDILARVHWVSNEAINATPSGKYYLGEASITVDPEFWSLLEAAQGDYGKVVVDGQDFEIIKINPLGAPEVNRVRAILRGLGERPDLG